MFSTPISNTINQKVYLLFGRAKSCKSSFIKDLCGEYAQITIETGFGRISTTKSLKFYSVSNPNLLNGTLIYFIDTVGWRDPNEDFSNDEIAQMIGNFLLVKANQNHIDGILITETMTNDDICLKKSLKLLHQIFSVSVVDSSIVLATKSSAVADKEALKERFDELQKVAAEKGIGGGVMPFETLYKSSKEVINFSQQLQELNYRLKFVKKLLCQNLMAIEAVEEEEEEEVSIDILYGMFPQTI